MQQEEMVPNPNGFFDNLDVLGPAELRRKSSLSFVSKKQRLELQLQRITEREEKLAQARAKKEADL